MCMKFQKIPSIDFIGSLNLGGLINFGACLISVNTFFYTIVIFETLGPVTYWDIFLTEILFLLMCSWLKSFFSLLSLSY